MPGTIEAIENNAYRIKYLKVDAEVGNKEVSGFKPKLKLKRWEGECFLDIGFQECDEEELEEETDVEGNITKLKWKVKTADFELELEYEPVEPRIETVVVNGKEHKFLQNEEGSLEFRIVFGKKPLVNTFQFPIQTKGLRYAKQPSLHPNHPIWNNGAVCPENVVGSYAVYHATKKNNEYMTGKAFHIYRPKAIDSSANEVWCDLNIENNVLTVTVPQSFLDSAVYPVVIDPDFGYTTTGSSWELLAGFGTTSVREGSAWTMPAGGGTANWIKAYLKGDALTCDCKAFINQKDSVAAGQHGQIAGPVENLNCIVAVHWEEFTLSSEALTGGVVYILNAVGNKDDTDASNSYWIAYDEDGCVASYGEAHNYGTPESPWVVDPEGTTRDYSIYCNYTAAPPVEVEEGGLRMTLSLKGHMGYDLKTRGGKARRRTF